MTAQFQFFQSLPHKKADFVKKKPAEHGVVPLSNDILRRSLPASHSTQVETHETSRDSS